MSIPVEVIDLATKVAEYGAGYLLTSGADGRPHAAHLEFAVDGAELTCQSGRSSVRNIGERPTVALLWPPIEPGGYSLIADGDASVADADTNQVVITVTHAVLHRPATAATPTTGEGEEADGCAQDCAPVSIGEG